MHPFKCYKLYHQHYNISTFEVLHKFLYYGKDMRNEPSVIALTHGRVQTVVHHHNKVMMTFVLTSDGGLNLGGKDLEYSDYPPLFALFVVLC